MLLEITWRTDGLCVDCFRGVLGSQIAEVEVRSRSRSIVMRRQSQNHNPNKGNRATKHASTKAARFASNRLRQLFPDLYDCLLAEERQRFGLDPFPHERTIQQPDTMTASETIDFARVYDALNEHGVELDGPEGAPA